MRAPVLLTRRRFLAHLTSLTAAAGASLAACGGRWRPQERSGRQGLIDVHHHLLPPVYLGTARERVVAQGQGFLPAPVLAWTPEGSLAEMDASGITTSILSISTPGVSFGDAPAARRLARACNEYAARLVRDHPGRFGFFAVLPLPEVDGALAEIEYALDVLQADGVGLLTSYGGRWPGDPTFAPILELLNRRRAVAYVHPTGPDCCRELVPDVPYVFTELPHDTTRAITSLLFSGALARFPDIRFIFSHAGGTLPMVVGRIARQSRAMPNLAARVPQGVEYQLRRIHYEIAGSANAPAMAALTQMVPASQILFGSDYPWGRAATTADGLAAVRLSAADRQAIAYENALRIFPRLRARSGA